MSNKTPQIKIIEAEPLGADRDPSGETEFVSFLLPSGDRLHVEMTTGGLQTLSLHIAHALAQAPAASALPKEK